MPNRSASVRRQRRQQVSDDAIKRLQGVPQRGERVRPAPKGRPSTVSAEAIQPPIDLKEPDIDSEFFTVEPIRRLALVGVDARRTLQCRIELSALFEREHAPVAQWIEQLTSDYLGGCAVAASVSGRA